MKEKNSIPLIVLSFGRHKSYILFANIKEVTEPRWTMSMEIKSRVNGSNKSSKMMDESPLR